MTRFDIIRPSATWTPLYLPAENVLCTLFFSLRGGCECSVSSFDHANTVRVLKLLIMYFCTLLCHYFFPGILFLKAVCVFVFPSVCDCEIREHDKKVAAAVLTMQYE